MKKGYVTYKPGEYVLIDKYTGKFVVGYEKTETGMTTHVNSIRTALGRLKVVLFTKDEAFKMLNDYDSNYTAIETNKVTVTYGIKYGESGNYYKSPFQTAIKSFELLEPEEKMRFLHYLGGNE